jgi:hypothetical protein|tara:strand:+ start:368 stop:637 length:270 start_codon:yes stop_codon:yes gene_type:complete
MNKYTKEVKDINTVTKKFNELFNNNLDHIDLCNQISHLTVQVLLFHNQSINEINNIFSNAIKKGIMKQKKEIENKYQDLKQKLKIIKGN